MLSSRVLLVLFSCVVCFFVFDCFETGPCYVALAGLYKSVCSKEVWLLPESLCFLSEEHKAGWSDEFLGMLSDCQPVHTAFPLVPLRDGKRVSRKIWYYTLLREITLEVFWYVLCLKTNSFSFAHRESLGGLGALSVWLCGNPHRAECLILLFTFIFKMTNVFKC